MCKYLQHLPEVSNCFISPFHHSYLQVSKKILVKIFSGPVWEQRLVEFVGVFTNRRKEFILALSIHTAVAVDEANVKLNVIDQRTAEIIQRCVPRVSVVHPMTDDLG